MVEAALSARTTYWCSRPLVVIVRGPDGKPVETRLDKPFARIGSDPECDVVLSAKGVPSQCLYLHATQEAVYCLGLSAGKLAGALPNGWLRPKVHARLGPYRINAQFGDDGPPPERCDVDPRARGSASNGLRLTIEPPQGKQPAIEKVWRRQLTLVGRSAPSTLRLLHPKVSRTHCVLFWDGDCLWAVDLHSTAGVRVEGRRVDSSRVRPGETLEIGGVRITYRPSGEASQPDWLHDSADVFPVEHMPLPHSFELPGNRDLLFDLGGVPRAEDDVSRCMSEVNPQHAEQAQNQIERLEKELRLADERLAQSEAERQQERAREQAAASELRQQLEEQTSARQADAAARAELAAELAGLRQQRDELRRELEDASDREGERQSAAEAQIRLLGDELEQARRRSADAEAEHQQALQSVRQSVTELEARLEQAALERETDRSAREQLAAGLIELEHQRDRLQQELAVAMEQVREQQSEAAFEREEGRRLAEEALLARDELAEAKRVRDVHLDADQRTLAQIERDCKRLADELEAQRQAHEQLMDQVGRLEQERERLEAELAAASEQVAKQAASAAMAEREMERLAGQLRQAQDELAKVGAEHRLAREENQRAASEHERQLEELARDRHSAEEVRRQLLARLDELEHDRGQLEARMAAADDREMAEQAAAQARREEIDRLAGELERARHAAQEAETNYHQLLATEQQATIALRREVETLARSRQADAQRGKQLEAQLEQLAHQRDDLERQLTAARHNVEQAARLELESRGRQIERLGEQVRQSRDELAREEARHRQEVQGHQGTVRALEQELEQVTADLLTGQQAVLQLTSEVRAAREELGQAQSQFKSQLAVLAGERERFASERAALARESDAQRKAAEARLETMRRQSLQIEEQLGSARASLAVACEEHRRTLAEQQSMIEQLQARIELAGRAEPDVSSTGVAFGSDDSADHDCPSDGLVVENVESFPEPEAPDDPSAIADLPDGASDVANGEEAAYLAGIGAGADADDPFLDRLLDFHAHRESGLTMWKVAWAVGTAAALLAGAAWYLI